MKKISAAKIEKIKGLLKCGMVGDEVAKHAGVSVATVNKVRKEVQKEGFDIWHRGGTISKSIKL